MSEDVPEHGEVDRAAGKLFDVAGDIAQRTYEAICSEDVLAEIPVIKLVVAGAATVRAIRSAILFRKLEGFLDPMSAVSSAERREMVEQLEADPTYQRQVGEHVIELLDRQDSHRKPKITGEIFAALARKQIDHTMFHRLLNVADRLPVMEIDTVRRFVESKNNKPERDLIDPESLQALVNAGLASTQITSPLGGNQTFYYENPTCEKFVELNLDLKSAP
jgi:hypothetical protein